jgi:hypothetical protein
MLRLVSDWMEVVAARLQIATIAQGLIKVLSHPHCVEKNTDGAAIV